MQHLQAGQIKAARAMLDWTREDLSNATGLSLNTIRNLEAGTISPRATTNLVIRQAIESKGLEFTDYEGVRRRPTDILLYRGQSGCDTFIDDLLLTSKQRGGVILVVCTTPDMLLQAIGATVRNTESLKQICAVTNIRCLLSECREPSFAFPAIQFRALSKPQVCPSAYFVYGDKVAFVMSEDKGDLRFIIVQSASTARHWGGHFLELWNEAIPFLAPTSTRCA